MPIRKRARVGPHGDRVERAEPADAVRDGRPVARRRAPSTAVASSTAEPGGERPAAAERDRRGHRRASAATASASGPGTALPEPELELAEHHQARRRRSGRASRPWGSSLTLRTLTRATRFSSAERGISARRRSPARQRRRSPDCPTTPRRPAHTVARRQSNDPQEDPP